MSGSADMAISTVNSILVVTCIIGNSLVCAIIKRNREMRIPMNYLLVNMAVGDMFQATFHITELVYSHIATHPDGFTGKVVCVIRNGAIQWIGASSSIFTLVVIALERYFSVVYPYANKGKLTMRKLKVIIPCSWIFSMILNVQVWSDVMYVKDTKRCVSPEQWINKANIVKWSAFIVISSTVVISLYSRVVYTLWFKRQDDNVLTPQQQIILPCSWLLPLIINIPRFLNKHFNKKIDPVFCVQLWLDKWIVKAHSLTWLVSSGLSFTLMTLLYTRVVYTLWFKRNDDNVLPYSQQGVLKVRKRVTLMVVTVSAIFGICWGAKVTVQISHRFTSYKFSPVVVAIANIVVMLNSAVNPFAYALINQRFRQKIQRMICFARALKKVHTKEN